jgi:hypothetical protein
MFCKSSCIKVFQSCVQETVDTLPVQTYGYPPTSLAIQRNENELKLILNCKKHVEVLFRPFPEELSLFFGLPVCAQTFSC